MTVFIVCIAICGCGKAPQKASVLMSEINDRMEIYSGAFGKCCDDLKHCMQQPNCLLYISEDGTFFLTIGYVQTDEGTEWMDHTIIFCPFCGKRLQVKRELADKIKDE
ncbi:MAG: hypothetical protein ABIK28_01005 [Planctomycetota bacterium]